MGLSKLTFRPGINTQFTPTLNEAGFTAGNWTRFRDGLPQPVGGWVQTAPTTSFAGICRGLHSWSTLSGTPTLGVGTNSGLYVYQGTALESVTPSGFTAGPVNSDGGVNALVWSIDNWGENMVCCPRGGALSQWVNATGYGTPAQTLTNAPLYNNSILTGLPERHLISFGCETGGVLDPMLVRWSDTENNTIWTATANNAAGSLRLAGGNQIMSAAEAPGEILVWTDAVLFAMRFEGYPYIYGFYQLGAGCGLVAPHAAIVINGVAFWMSYDGFLSYNGTVVPLHCDVWDAVFRNINTAQQWKTFAFSNISFTEVGWAYCSTNSTEIDSVAVYDTVGNTWWLGSWAGYPASRTAWEDITVFPNPIAAGTDGQLYSHESGQTANGAALGDYVQSGFLDIVDGEDFAFLDQLIPDFGEQTGSVAVEISSQYFPNGPTTTLGPFNVAATTPYLSPRLRGRQVAFRFSSVGVGTFYRLGAVRARITPDGRQ